MFKLHSGKIHFPLVKINSFRGCCLFIMVNYSVPSASPSRGRYISYKAALRPNEAKAASHKLLSVIRGLLRLTSSSVLISHRTTKLSVGIFRARYMSRR